MKRVVVLFTVFYLSFNAAVMAELFEFPDELDKPKKIEPLKPEPEQVKPEQVKPEPEQVKPEPEQPAELPEGASSLSEDPLLANALNQHTNEINLIEADYKRKLELLEKEKAIKLERAKQKVVGVLKRIQNVYVSRGDKEKVNIAQTLMDAFNKEASEIVKLIFKRSYIGKWRASHRIIEIKEDGKFVDEAGYDGEWSLDSKNNVVLNYYRMRNGNGRSYILRGSNYIYIEGREINKKYDIVKE